jgi:hypothetical protein
MFQSTDQEKRAMNIVFAIAMIGVIVMLAGIPAIGMIFKF